MTSHSQPKGALFDEEVDKDMGNELEQARLRMLERRKDGHGDRLPSGNIFSFL